jgi:hypothetical protein
LGAVFRLALRQTEGLTGSIITLLGLGLAVPDHTTLTRRAETLDTVRPRPSSGPVHLLVDSTGLKLCGSGEAGRGAARAASGIPAEGNGCSRSTARRHGSRGAQTAPTMRDRHLQVIAERGRMAWQKAFVYHWRALVEAAISCLNRVVGDGLRFRSDRRQATEIAIAIAIAVNILNRRLEPGRPEYVRFP